MWREFLDLHFGEFWARRSTSAKITLMIASPLVGYIAISVYLIVTTLVGCLGIGYCGG